MRAGIFSVSAILTCIFCLNFFNVDNADAASFCSSRFTESGVLDMDFVNDGSDDTSPVIQTDGHGSWIAAWQHKLSPANPLSRPLSYVLLKRSATKGDSWQETQWVSCGSTNCFSYASQPQVATDSNGKWVVAWTDMYSAATAGGDIIFSRSTDNGQTWSEPSRINALVATDSRQFNVDAIAYGQNAWIVTGSYFNEGHETVYYYRSTNAGASWTGPLYIDNTSGTSKSFVKLATDNSGNWVAGWTSSDSSSALSDNYIMTGTSNNGGISWSVPKNQGFHSFAGAYIGDLKYSSLNGYWVMVWESDVNVDNPLSGAVSYNILSSYSNNNGSSWSPAAWLYGGADDTSDDIQPRLYNDNSGNLSCAWYRSDNYGSTIGQDAWIYRSCSTNGGSSWQGVEDLNRSMQTGVLIEEVPSMAMDSDGKVLAFWSTKRAANGSASADANVFFSRAVSARAGANVGPNFLLLRKP